MITITKDNIREYLKQHMEGFDPDSVTSITMIGEGTPEEDGDGYVNFIFRVHTTVGNYVLKQGLLNARVSEAPMSLYRNKLEYDNIRIRYALTPEYVPKPYFCDEENCVFVMEDVSDLKISRFWLNKNVAFEDFGYLCGEFMAKNEFYTSEYYLDRQEYRRLQQRFENLDLRKLMEDGMFLDRFWTAFDSRVGEEFKQFASDMSSDENYVTELYKVRRKYMSHADALIHADLHTSNIFADDGKMKVIDMEFSFMGPFGYDLGYLAGNLISQYASACFRPFASEQERREFKAYLLATIKTMYQTYFDTFAACWHKDCKERYVGQDGLRKSILDEVLVDSVGYASMVNWFRVASEIEYPDFDIIDNLEDRRLAKTLSLLLDWQIMFSRYGYMSVDDLIDTILYVEEMFMKKL